MVPLWYLLRLNLAQGLQVEVVDVASEFEQAVRATAISRRFNWDFVLRTDAEPLAAARWLLVPRKASAAVPTLDGRWRAAADARFEAVREVVGATRGSGFTSTTSRRFDYLTASPR